MTSTARTFAERNERERLMATFADLVYEQGYDLTRLADLPRRAGTTAEQVSAYWVSEEECAVDTVDTCAEQLFGHVAQVLMRTPGDYPYAAHTALATLLDDMAGMPTMLHLALVEFPELSARTRSRADGWFAQFAEFLGPGFAALDVEPPDPEIVTMMIGGGILGVLRQHVLEHRVGRLPDALPAISYMCLSTFFGIDEARRVLRLDARPGGRRAPAQRA